MERITQQQNTQLRVLWDADSVPYSEQVQLAVLAEMGAAEVRSIEVFTSSATAAAFSHSACVDADAPDVAVHPAKHGADGAVLGSTACLLECLQEGKHAAGSMHAIVSNSPAVRDALVALGAPRAAAVTSAMHAPDSTAIPPPVPQGTSWLHLTLALPEPAHADDAVDACAEKSDEPAVLQEPEVRGPPQTLAQNERLRPTEAQAPEKRATSTSNARMRTMAYGATWTAPAADDVQRMLRQPQRVLCAVLCSCLLRVPGDSYGSLLQRLLAARDWLGEDFPYEVLTRPSLRDALVAGLGEGSSWVACERTAVLEALATFAPPSMLAQIGLLALDPDRPELPDSRTAPLATAATADMACVSCGMAILMHLRDDLRTAPDPDAVGPTGAPAVKTPQLPPEPPKQQDWQRLVSVLLRLSPDWFSEAFAMVRSKRRLCSNIEHFPEALQAEDDFREDDFGERLVALLRSPQVDVRQKQAVVRAVVKFNHAVLFAELGFISGKKKIKMPGKREDRTRIYESKRWQRAGKDLLQTFLVEPEPAPFTPNQEKRPARL